MFKEGDKVIIQPFAFRDNLYYGEGENRKPHKIEKKDVFVIILVEWNYSFVIKRLSDGQLFDCIGYHDLDSYSLSNRIFRLFVKYPYSPKSLIFNPYCFFIRKFRSRKRVT